MAWRPCTCYHCIEHNVKVAQILISTTAKATCLQWSTSLQSSLTLSSATACTLRPSPKPVSFSSTTSPARWIVKREGYRTVRQFNTDIKGQIVNQKVKASHVEQNKYILPCLLILPGFDQPDIDAALGLRCKTMLSEYAWWNRNAFGGNCAVVNSSVTTNNIIQTRNQNWEEKILMLKNEQGWL